MKHSEIVLEYLAVVDSVDSELTADLCQHQDLENRKSKYSNSK